MNLEPKCDTKISGKGRYGSFQRHSCGRLIWKDGKCKVHHPESVQIRYEKSIKHAEEKNKESIWYKYQKAQDRIVALEMEVIVALEKEVAALKERLYPKPQTRTCSTEELNNADPDCKHEVVDAPGGGIKCTKCQGWFCF